MLRCTLALADDEVSGDNGLTDFNVEVLGYLSER
jgi:hypothetical protein